MSTLPLFTSPMASTARISPCGRYRYSLSRVWATELPQVCFLMLNPSTATAEVDDPTIRRCVGFAKAWGCGGLVVANLFAWRATDPSAIRCALIEPVGAENDAAILEAVSGRRVIAAWGTHGTYLKRDRAVAELLVRSGVTVECLGRTKDGHPWHPLYIPGATVPERWFYPATGGRP